jgi:putative transposase
MSKDFLRRPNSLRLKGYDYSQCGAYHIICSTHGAEDVMGSLANFEVRLNETGQSVEETWQQLPDYYPGVLIDVCKVMPDHFHGLLVLNNPKDFNLAASPRTLSLPDVVQRFKSLTTYKHRLATERPKLWKRGYWDEIISSPQQFETAQEYIHNNAVKDWLKRNGSP